MIGEIFSVESFVRTCLWQSIVLIAVGLSASFLLRRRSSRAHQVLLLSIVAAVIVPVVSTLVKHYELGVFVAKPVAMRPQLEVQPVAGDFSQLGPVVQDFGYEPGPIEAGVPPVITGSQSAPLPWEYSSFTFSEGSKSVPTAFHRMVTSSPTSMTSHPFGWKT